MSNIRRKHYKRQKKCTELDDFDLDLVQRTEHEFYDEGEYPTALSILKEIKKDCQIMDSCDLLFMSLKRSFK